MSALLAEAAAYIDSLLAKLSQKDAGIERLRQAGMEQAVAAAKEFNRAETAEHELSALKRYGDEQTAICQMVIDERDELRAKLEVAQEDAERYRWLLPLMFAGSSSYPRIETHANVPNPHCIHLSRSRLEEAIDAARAEKP